MKLREIAHSRAGDKGNISNISLIVYEMILPRICGRVKA